MTMLDTPTRAMPTPAEKLIARKIDEELEDYAMPQAVIRVANTLGISTARVAEAYKVVARA